MTVVVIEVPENAGGGIYADWKIAIATLQKTHEHEQGQWLELEFSGTEGNLHMVRRFQEENDVCSDYEMSELPVQHEVTKL